MKRIVQKFLPRIIGKKINTISLYNLDKAALQAFVIFCTPRAGRVGFHQKEFLDEASSKSLTSGDNTIQTYHWKGSGKKVLLIHGWESNSYRWHLFVEELQAKDFDIYAIDAPAHGSSSGRLLNVPLYAAAINTAVEKFNPEVIISHSIGALATIFHQYKYQPTKIQKLVLLGSPSELNVIMQDYKKILRLNNRTMKALEKLVRSRFGYGFKEFSGSAFAKAVTIPTLLIHDKHDKITPVEASRSIHHSIKGSKLIETEGFGHSLHQKEVRAEILKFIEV